MSERLAKMPSDLHSRIRTSTKMCDLIENGELKIFGSRRRNNTFKPGNRTGPRFRPPRLTPRRPERREYRRDDVTHRLNRRRVIKSQNSGSVIIGMKMMLSFFFSSLFFSSWRPERRKHAVDNQVVFHRWTLKVLKVFFSSFFVYKPRLGSCIAHNT